MNDDSAREEERLLRTMMSRNKPAAAAVAKPARPNTTTTATATATATAANVHIPRSSSTVVPPTAAPRGPEPVSRPTAPTSSSSFSHSEQIEQLQLKKRTILGTITTTRRDLDDVRAEISKLKSKEAELISLMEKREQAVHQLNLQIEEFEQTEQTEKTNAEEHKRKVDEEKARKIREENEKRKKEEEEAERKKKEAEEERRRQMVVNSSTYVGDTIDKTSSVRNRASAYARTTSPPTIATVPQIKTTQVPDVQDGEGLDPEEARLMRAMTRKNAGAPYTARGSSYKPAEPKPPIPSSKSQPANEPVWKELERLREAERAARVAEETRKKEENQRIAQEREAYTKHEEQQRIASIQNRGGINHTFITPVIYDFDAEVKICGDFTDWQEILITSEIDKNFSYPITLPVSPGIHFYRFKIDGKWEVNKNLPTGVAPTGELMNKVEL